MFEYIIIAILQGIVEWLPISSSGQVMIISITIFGISASDAFSLSIWLHFGTALAAMFRFRSDYFVVLKSLVIRNNGSEGTLTQKKRNWLIIATIGTAISAVPLYFFLKLFFKGIFLPIQGDIITLVISILLVITGVILLSYRKEIAEKELQNIPNKRLYKESLITGIVQGISILPGISRSGVTVSSMIFQKYNSQESLKLSFLMSVPVVFASIAVDILFGEGSVFGFLDLPTIVLITVISFLVGLVSIEFLLRLSRKIQFGYFCIIYGLIAIMVIAPFLFMSI